MIDIINCSFKVHNKLLLKNINCSIAPNEFVVIMGANGAGKSTLLKLMSGLSSASTGDLFLEKKLIRKFSSVELSFKRAVLSQHHEIAFPLTVKEIILMGRYPYFKNSPKHLHEMIVKELMEQMGIGDFGDRIYQTLSGGEAQKVQMCRVLAQINGTEKINRFLLLDEPVSHLDIKYQHQILEITKTIVSPFTAVIAVLHDINLALKFADRILFMKEGRIVHEHRKNNLLDISVIKQVFDVDATILNAPNENRQWVCF
jgi:iron complex transport system ATP-binding protein